ncbi:putative mitochondrial protein [Sesamum alatum]|uniref:Mitochondrial protein n=1 Tax=Sesamum alatum TaxID=300844 RepID=A0AAE1YMA5_9LAMI|nr:putative mitochondrial protein [Sesamum alatum]
MFPSVLMGSMLAGIFGDDLGHVWFHMMNQIAFRSPERTGSPSKARVYRFTRVQPLGYLSSWPSFTLTHHMVVWLAAYEVYPGKKFWDYAILVSALEPKDAAAGGILQHAEERGEHPALDGSSDGCRVGFRHALV